MNVWLTTEEVKAIVRMYFDSGLTQRVLARRYGVSQSQISLIINRKRHKKVKA